MVERTQSQYITTHQAQKGAILLHIGKPIILIYQADKLLKVQIPLSHTYKFFRLISIHSLKQGSIFAVVRTSETTTTLSRRKYSSNRRLILRFFLFDIKDLHCGLAFRQPQKLKAICSAKFVKKLLNSYLQSIILQADQEP